MNNIKYILVIFLFLQSPVFAEDIELVCNINKESLHLYRESTEIADHTQRYVDVNINETYYYKINVNKKSVIDLTQNKNKFYKLKEYVWFYQKHHIILDQVFKNNKNDENIIFTRLSINKFTGEFLLITKIIEAGDEKYPINYKKILKKGECAKSKNLF